MTGFNSNTRPFAICTSRLILLPSYLAIDLPAYRQLYSSLHRKPEFTTMAFGSAWGVKDWDEHSIVSIIAREVQNSWRVRGMGDFAVGVQESSSVAAQSEEWNVVQGNEIQNLDNVHWIGYVGVRDATTTSMRAESTSQPPTRPWQQMIELRYGFHPEVWGQGYGTEAAKAVIKWCEKSIGAERFIAETEIENLGSGKVLRKLGFGEMEMGKEVIWGMEGTKEWEVWVGR
ncbi:unnamed protein product [Aureobasidium uvarum]|uniref:N-acetyltransferase domain-containing protein n=1 Tax=Aureobasidium uvarum TaxID=2773716 RepID=A0A9N8PUI7_9PEZI|nr:unnamed protein product [Aureobasidium uvarum]